MKSRRVNLPVADATARRAEMARALLSVQLERVALTEAFMRLGTEAESGPAGIEAVLVRLLRLRRATDIAEVVARQVRPALKSG